MNEQQIISFIKKHFPTTPTRLVAEKVNLSIYQVRTIAKKHNIKKCPKYLKQQRKNLVKHRRKWFERNTPELKPTFEQEQIIFGSLLGDGYISKGAQRSINYYYQEHFGENQKDYRKWKEEMLKDLHFKISGNYLRSPSHPYFTKLEHEIYKDNIKILSKDFLNKCTHPLFLTTLYLDDGSLTISYTFNKNKNVVYCHPTITIHTLNFTKKENLKLATHLNKTFKTNFILTRCPDGNKYLLKLNKQSEVEHLLTLIKPYTKNIPSMKYKTDVKENIRKKEKHIFEKFNKDVTIKISSSNQRRRYRKEEIDKLISLKKRGITDQAIADKLNRTYWSIVYKLSELRKAGML